MKRILAFVLASFILLTAASVYVIAEDKITYGDVNCDGGINIRDVTDIMKYAAKWDMSIHCYNFSVEAADVTQDGIVNTQDALKILKYIVGWGPQLLLDPQA